MYFSRSELPPAASTALAASFGVGGFVRVTEVSKKSRMLSRLRTGMRVAAHAQRRVSSAAHPRLVDARSETDSGEVVTLRWDDGAQASFHRLWLRDNCVSTRHESSRQKLTSAACLPDDLHVQQLRAEPDRLRVVWGPDGHESDFSAGWLRQLAAGQAGLEAGAPRTQATAAVGAVPAAAAAPPSLPCIAYDELVSGGEPAVWRWLSALHETGATLLTGVPCEPEKVTEVARLVGPVQPQIYGEAWDVIAQVRVRGHPEPEPEPEPEP